jgi:hypothetical protein
MLGDFMQLLPQVLKLLWAKDVFDSKEGRTFEEIKKELADISHHPTDESLLMALSRAEYLTRTGTKGNYRYKQKRPSKELMLKEDIFPLKLITKLGSEFETEIKDLRHNFGTSGTCTAFLLRKMLEKLIFVTFAKENIVDKLKDNKGDFVGLKTMLNLASAHKSKGTPFLMPKTAKEIEGIKFLGDTSAHNPLVTVDMKTILPVMPFIVTAYEELANKL